VGAASTLAHGADRIRRCTIVIEGVVQGVGFRPFVYRLAQRHQLAGCVRNSVDGVVVEAQGREEVLVRFVDELRSAAPPGARCDQLRIAWTPPRGGMVGFAIEESRSDGELTLSPAPDLAVCAACLRELADPTDRRHQYPFLNCTACGPRFTIVRRLPYDRERTSMVGFTMCAACRAEYEDPRDRRFHAEPTACPTCGPRVCLRRADGSTLPAADPIGEAATAIRAGAIVAVKGLGGYHLACDATSGASVRELRRRKGREAKPLAIMVQDLAAARALCAVSPAEATLLEATARPIVVLIQRADCAIADEVAPRRRQLGVMLAYTPLHHLLLGAATRPLVMTSGNRTDEPVAFDDDDALTRLRDVADLFLVHDRPIQAPCDDSVARVVRGVPLLLRRSRGYVPFGIRLPVPAPEPILACGGELKSVFALARDGHAFLSQHIGDLTDERAFRAFVAAVEHFRGLFKLAPRVVAHDLHPGYRSTVYAKSLTGVERIAVQHHHAHIASCLADNGIDARAIGVAWDGTGYGADGHVWGGEFLVADLAGFERVGHLEEVPLAGGEAAIREPWRMAAVLLRAAYGEAMDRLDIAFLQRLDRVAWRILNRAAEAGLNAPLTSSAGRLFDAVASLLGLRDVVAFEGQAAMELEALAAPAADRTYATTLVTGDDHVVVRTTDVIRGVVEDLLGAVEAGLITARFHATLAEVIARVCDVLRGRTGLDRVALSGGVFQNAWLLEATLSRLEANGFEVYRHRQVSPNDSGLALGQAAVAARWLAERR
jgi:hydrogenase maturation protein HypF